MNKYITLFIVIFSVSSAQAGIWDAIGKFTSNQVFSYWVSGKVTQKLGSGLIGNIATDIAIQTFEDAVLNPVFSLKYPSMNIKNLFTTTGSAIAEHCTTHAILNGVLYLLGITSATNPYSATTFALASRLAVNWVKVLL